MKNIGNLVRAKNATGSTQRKTFGNVNMVRRKDLRRLKKINIYHKDLTNEQNPNTWFTAKKLKAMGNHIQKIRNTHIGTVPIQKKQSQQLLKIFNKLSDYQYWKARNLQQQKLEMKAKVQQSNLDFFISQMPAKFRKQIENAEEQPVPQILQPLLRYSQQYQIYLPIDQRHRWNLLSKLAHPPISKIQEQDDD